MHFQSNHFYPACPRVAARLYLAGFSILAGLLLGSSARAATGDITRDASGVTLETASGLTRVEIWGDRIARVMHTPTTTLPVISSLAVTGTPAAVTWQFQNNGTYLLLSSSSMTVRMETASGQVRFLDSAAATLLAESTSGTTLTATTVGSPAVASYIVKQNFDLASGEAIYGLGQQQGGVMNWVGQSVVLQQKNMYVGVPVLLSNKGYSVLWDNPAVTTVDAGKATSGKLSWSSEAGDAVNYYFCYGPEPDAAIAGYRALTGAAPMFGKWAWGFWQCKERYQTQTEILGVASQYRSLGIPIDGVIQDWRYWPDLDSANPTTTGWGSHLFDPTRYPDPAGMMNTLHAENVHLLISVWAKFDVTSAATGSVSIPNLQQLESVNGVFNPAIPYVYPAGQGKWLDPFRPAARQTYWSQISQKIFAKGVDGWWLDASEAEFSGNWGEFRTFNTALGPGAKVYNAYPLMETTGVYEGQRAETSAKRAIILTRSAYAGQQRNAAITWSGDINGDWSTFANQIPGGLNFVSSGIPYWNTDIGGFGSGDPSTAAYAELFTRWFQYGAFCPMFRVHGTNYAKEVWRFPSATQPILKNFINLRYRLLPYIYSTAWKVTNEGYTMMRPLVMDFRNDANVNGIGNQYMFGPALLVNPVTTQGATSRSVYLPAGTAWYDFWSGLKQDGGQTIQAGAPIDKMPLYLKAGSILPLGPFIQYATQSSDPIELRVYPGANGSFTLYEDEGDNYNYESGSRATIPFTWDETTQQLTIGQRSGSFPGMLANHTFRVVFVSPVHGAGLDSNATPDAVVSYDGSAVVVPRPPLPAVPSAPQGAIASPSSNGITVSWTGPTEGTVYRVQRALQSGGPYTTVADSVIGTTYLDTGLDAGTRYFYIVTASNAGGEGTASSEVSAIYGTPALRTLLMFNEASGTIAADGSGKGFHATLVNGPTRVVGKGGNAMDLSGTSQYASLPAGPMSSLNNFTIAAWVNLDAATQGAHIFDFGSGTNSYMFLASNGAGN
jgi:alpha-D-xyloside xylohydrolase